MSAPAGFLPRDHFLTAAMRKGAPFAGYEDFDDCTSQNSGKRDPDAYCGEIKHRTEDKTHKEAASGLPQIQQLIDPNNQPVPEDDELPVGVAFPLGDNAPSSTFRQQWSTGPEGPQPRTGAMVVEAVNWGRRHYEDLASAISGMPEHVRGPVAREFARQMPHPQNGLGMFDREKFVGAATDPDSYSWRSRGRQTSYSRGHYQAVADMLRGVRNGGEVSEEDFQHHVYPAIAGTMHAGAGFTPNGNRNFDADRFHHWVHGEGEAPPRRQTAPRAPRMRDYYPQSRPQAPSHARGIDPGTESGLSDEGTHYDPYGEGFTNPSRGGRPPEGQAEYDPVFGWRNISMLRRLAYAGMSSDGAYAWGRADAMGNASPSHQSDFGDSKQKHGRYLRGWNEVAGLIHGLVGRAAMSKEEYGRKTGRPDLHSHYLEAYARGRSAHGNSSSLYRADDGGQVTAAMKVIADTWSQPHQTTDDFDPPYNSPETSPDPWSANASPESGDFAAGTKAGQADKAAGERPLFADNSSGVSPYVKGYAQGYGQPGQFGTQQDVPRSMGGDSGQAYNAQQAQQSFQVARASKTASVQDAWAEARDNLEARHQVDGGHPVSGAPGSEHLEGEGTGGRSGANWRVSASFTPDSLMKDPEFSRAYKFAQIWEPGLPLVKQGSARFEAGLYAGITDRDRASQTAWLAEHARHAGKHPELARRIALHESFTVKVAKKEGIRAHGVYVQGMNARQAGTMTDLITDGPGTSPDPMGATPLNGPGSPPPMGGLGLPAAPGGAPPYQGAPPLPGGPVVPDDVMGRPQQPPTPDGAFTNTFSGNHPENAVLAPVAPNTANQSGYSNHDAYQGSPRGADRLAAFRRTVQANLAQSGAR